MLRCTIHNVLPLTLLIMITYLALAPSVHGNGCKILMNGISTTNWGKLLDEGPPHMVHRMTPVKVPCAGFLTKDDLYLRSGSSDYLIVDAVFFNHEFLFLDELFSPKGRIPPTRIIDVGANNGLAAR